MSSALQAQENKPGFDTSHLTGDFYIYTTYQIFNGELFPANSMYMVTSAGVVLFDTPWDLTQCEPLLDHIEKVHHKPVILCIATHFHSDRTGGFDFLKEKGIATYSSKLTQTLCRERKEKEADYTFSADTTFVIGQHTFQTFYPGEGHSKDNIVIWFEQDKILYGGCFIKSTEAGDLGNLADANPGQWSNSIDRVQKKIPSRRYVIPGHQGWSDGKGLEHTLLLLKKRRSGH